MATLIDATCSECFSPQLIDLNPKRREIRCEFCNHSVPMVEKRDIDSIRATLAQENRKLLIALALFAGTIFLFGIYVIVNSKDDKTVVQLPEGPQEGYLVKRTPGSIVIQDPKTDVEKTIDFKTAFSADIAARLEALPHMPEERAAEFVADGKISVDRHEPGGMPFLVLAALCGLATIAFSAIATADRLVCEF